jgi:hypothetical protein
MTTKNWGMLEPDTAWKSRRREEKRIEPKARALMNEAGWKVYVSPEMARADLKRAERLFADNVRHDTHGVLKGEIRGFNAEGSPPLSGDMRDTWALTLVDPKTKEVVDFYHFAPLADPDQNYDHEMEVAMDLARKVESGTMTRADALKRMVTEEQTDAENGASEELDLFLGSLTTDEMFPKYASWERQNSVRVHEANRVANEKRKSLARVWQPRTFKRPVAVRTYWRRGASKFIAAHRREHPRAV